MKKIRLTHSICSITAVCLLALGVSGCDLAKNQLQADRSGGMEIQDYRDGLAPRLPDVDTSTQAKKKASIPALQPYVAGLSEGHSSMPLVSISINQTVPLRDALYQLSQQANYDIELDPRISGAIIFTARERPFDEVIDRISNLAGLRYSFQGESIRVQLDTPYLKTYKVDYLSLVKTSSSSIRNDISVVSGDGADTGSNFQSSFENEIDYWGELETNIQQIMAAQATDLMVTGSDPIITAAAQNPNVVPLVTDASTGAIAPPDVNLNIGSLPIGSSAEGVTPSTPSYAINKQAGIVQVFATERTQEEIEKYLELVRKSTTAQVLIEAKILEVSLADEYVTGIDWRAVDRLGGELDLGYATGSLNGPILPTIPLLGTNATNSAFFAQYSGDDVGALVTALSQFGTVKALASPRLTVLNNQSAVLNVATNRVFFEVDVQTTQNDLAPPTVTLESQIQNVPEGVLVSVQPSINLDKGTISMALRPTVTRIASTQPDPAVAIAAADVGLTGLQSLIPELNVQEIDSVIEARSGSAVVLGGLLQDRAVSTIEGVPIASELPVIGSLFRQNDDSISKTELVILLKATILDDPSDSVQNTDRDLYRRFSGDRRPFKL